MTKKELFKKYNINETHSVWDDSIDNWMSVEVFRIMHEGRLPTDKDLSLKYIVDLMDKFKSDSKFMNELMSRKDWGSIYLTSKRQIYLHSDLILKELNHPIL